MILPYRLSFTPRILVPEHERHVEPFLVQRHHYPVVYRHKLAVSDAGNRNACHAVLVHRVNAAPQNFRPASDGAVRVWVTVAVCHVKALSFAR